MSRHGIWGVGAWTGVVTGLSLIAWAGMAPIGASASAPAGPVVPAVPSALRTYPADSLVGAVTSRDVFRMDRRPAVLEYNPARIAAPPAPPGPPKPSLTLVGLIAGGNATAVIDGLPGAEGSRVLRVGDVVSGLRVARIERDRVVIVGMDTTWILTVREPWR